MFLSQGGPNRTMAYSTRRMLGRDEYGFTPMYQAAMSLMEEVGITCFFSYLIFQKIILYFQTLSCKYWTHLWHTCVVYLARWFHDIVRKVRNKCQRGARTILHVGFTDEVVFTPHEKVLQEINPVYLIVKFECENCKLSFLWCRFVPWRRTTSGHVSHQMRTRTARRTVTSCLQTAVTSTSGEVTVVISLLKEASKKSSPLSMPLRFHKYSR